MDRMFAACVKNGCDLRILSSHLRNLDLRSSAFICGGAA